MFQNRKPEHRGRGRPRARSDQETRRHIVDVADRRFRSHGYALSGMGAIARAASVSTRTVYRLFPGKADLLADVISRQISRHFAGIDVESLRGLSTREGMVRLLTAYGSLTLSLEAVRMAKLVLEESQRFPEVSAAFYEKALVPTNLAIENWLRDQRDAGRIALSDPREVSGILRGMMIMEPQRAAIFLQRTALDQDEIARRAENCADRFLKGCRAERRKSDEAGLGDR